MEKKKVVSLAMAACLLIMPACGEETSEAEKFDAWFNSVETVTPEPTAAPAVSFESQPIQFEEIAVPETGAQLEILYDTVIMQGPGENYRAVGALSSGNTVEFTGVALSDDKGMMWYAIDVGGPSVWVSSAAVAVSAAQPEEITAQPEEITVPTVEMAENSIGRYTGGYAVEVSSYRRNNNPSVSGSCAVDSNLGSAWNTHNNISGEWLKLSVKDGWEYQIAGLRIANGYWKDNSVYKKNSKVKTFDVYCDGEYVTTAQIDNVKSFQTVWFDAPVTGSSIKLVIQSGYKGSKYYDCCITEIELLGPGGQTLHPEVLNDWGSSVRAAADKAQGGRIEKGSYGMAVVGLQILLKEGFGILEGSVDGSFGEGTKGAVQTLAGRIRAALPDCEPMNDGVVDAAFWRNMLRYMETLH